MRQRFGCSCLLLMVTAFMLQDQAVVASSSEPTEVPLYLYWDAWSTWTSCSRPCGGGVAKRNRTCVDDSSDGEGSLALKNDDLCPGDDRQYRSCNTQGCEDEDSTDFRELQCLLFNSDKHDGDKHHDWLPYIHHDKNNSINPCALNCAPDGEDFYETLRERVIDGTPCSEDRGNPGVCADGTCLATGCDGQIGSSLQYDDCGMCGGNGSSCFPVGGYFDISVNQPKSYYVITVIPEGSRNIQVQQTKPAKSYLAIEDNVTRGEYYLNGNFTIDPPGLYHIAGTVFNYKRESVATRYQGKGSLYAQGPTTRVLIIQMLAWGLKNHAFKFSYSRPIEDKGVDTTLPPLYTNPAHILYKTALNDSKSLFVKPGKAKKENVVPPTGVEEPISSPVNSVHPPRWVEGPFGSCSRSCGGGTKTAEHHCQKDHSILKDSECMAYPKPKDRTKHCRMYDCPPSWEKGTWSSCSKTCGGGVRRRTVECWQTPASGPMQEIPHKFCLTKRPAARESCNMEKCWGSWKEHKWKLCDNGCGNGNQERRVFCVDSKTGREQDNSQCNPTTRPNRQKSCYSRLNCSRGVWYVHNDWGPCSVSCGEGFQTKKVVCYGSRRGSLDYAILPDDMCNLTLKWIPTRPCNESCPLAWVTGNWSKCSKTCGTNGSVERTVECMQDGKPAKKCDGDTRPNRIDPCAPLPPCTKELPDGCVDKRVQFCAVLRNPLYRERKLCRFLQNRRFCCKTCHDMDQD